MRSDHEQHATSFLLTRAGEASAATSLLGGRLGPCLLLSVFAWCLQACAPAPDLPSSPPTVAWLGEAVGVEEDHHHDLSLAGTALRARFREGRAELVPAAGETPFEQVGLLADGDLGALAWRTRAPEGGWSTWRAPEVVFSEPGVHALRIRPESPATRLELRGAGGLTALSVRFQAVAPLVRVRWQDRPREVRPVAPAAVSNPTQPAVGLATRQDALVAPPAFVVDRAAWGARQPDLICNAPQPVYRFTVHHTASAADEGDMPARMRRIQAYHMDVQGWCDIGYHFVVSREGTPYQGRNDAGRPGAHAGRNNNGNVGMSLIGNFDEGPVPPAQFAGAARVLRWALDTYGIAPDRDAVRGHQEWPTNNTACPGAQLFPRMDELLALAVSLPAEGEVPEQPDPETPDPETPDPETPDPERGGTLDLPWTLRWTERPLDLLRQGGATGVPDLLVGDTAEVEWVVRNDSLSPRRDLELNLGLPAALAVTDAVIETDAPSGDRRSWRPVDAEVALDLPDAVALPAFDPGHSLRLRLTVQAIVPARGGAVTAWLRANDEPSSSNPPAHLEADVLSPEAWAFPAGAPDDVDGWVRCDDGPALAHDGDGLALGVGRCAAAPTWAGLDADRWSGLGVAFTAQLPGTLRVWFAAPGAPFDPAQRVVVRILAGAGGLGIDLRGHPGWRGTIGRLAIYTDVPITLQRVVAQDADTAAFGPPVAPWTDPASSSPAPPGDPSPPVDDPGGLGPDEHDGPAFDGGLGAVGQDTLQADGGCDQAPGRSGLSMGLLLLLGCLRRRARPAQ